MCNLINFKTDRTITFLNKSYHLWEVNSYCPKDLDHSEQLWIRLRAFDQGHEKTEHSEYFAVWNTIMAK